MCIAISSSSQKIRGRDLALLFRKLKVQNQGDSNNQDRNNATDNPLVPVHPSCHVRQNSLALSYVIIHSMKLQERIEWLVDKRETYIFSPLPLRKRNSLHFLLNLEEIISINDTETQMVKIKNVETEHPRMLLKRWQESWKEIFFFF